jgi:hypothetical protein
VANYLLVHHFPKGFQGSPETAAAAAAWFEQLSPHLAGRTLPEPEPRQFGDPGAEPVPTAFEVITTDDIEGALALAGAWPLVLRGGRIELRELTGEKFGSPGATPPVVAGTQTS